MKNKPVYITLTGFNYYYGYDYLEPGMVIKLKKDPKNKYDCEAIKAKLPGLGKIAYVANSPSTVVRDTWSAGRLYDKIGKKAWCKVVYVLHGAAVCTLIDKAEAVDLDLVKETASNILYKVVEEKNWIDDSED